MRNGRIENIEVKSVVGILVFALIWILFIIPFLVSSDLWNSFNPLIQYILYNFGFICITAITFGIIITCLLNEPQKLSKYFKNGLATWVGFSFIIDLWQPPFYIDSLGNPIYSEHISAVAHASSDGLMTYIFSTLFPSMQGTIILGFSLLYIAVYIFTPVLIVTLMALVLSKGRFLKWFSGKGEKIA